MGCSRRHCSGTAQPSLLLSPEENQTYVQKPPRSPNLLKPWLTSCCRRIPPKYTFSHLLPKKTLMLDRLELGLFWDTGPRSCGGLSHRYSMHRGRSTAEAGRGTDGPTGTPGSRGPPRLCCRVQPCACPTAQRQDRGGGGRARGRATKEEGVSSLF